DPAQESDSRHPGQVRPPRSGGDGSLRRAGPRPLLRQRLDLLPPHTAYATGQLLEQVESLDRQVTGFEHRIKSVFKPTLAIQRLMTLRGVGLTLAVLIALEIGAVPRFPTAEKLARDAGCTCRVHATGGTL